jgi:hypothetical protein
MNAIWPTVSDLDSAKKTARYGYGAAIAVSVLIIIEGFISIDSNYRIVSWNMIEVGSLLLAIVMIPIAYGIYRMSRIASVSGLLIFIAHIVSNWFVGIYPRPVVLIIIFFLYFHSIRGCFAYQSLLQSKEKSSSNRSDTDD